MPQPTSQYKWSESGQNLLQTIEHEIARSGGSYRLAKLIEHERHHDYNCTKRDCFYCAEFDRIWADESDIPIEVVSKPRPKNYFKLYRIRKKRETFIF